jgi:hypothetical protein
MDDNLEAGGGRELDVSNIGRCEWCVNNEKDLSGRP